MPLTHAIQVRFSYPLRNKDEERLPKQRWTAFFMVLSSVSEENVYLCMKLGLLQQGFLLEVVFLIKNCFGLVV